MLKKISLALALSTMAIGLPFASVDATPRVKLTHTKAGFDKSLAFCRKKFGTRLAGVQWGSHYGETHYWCQSYNAGR